MASRFPDDRLAPTRALLEASIALSAALDERAVRPAGLESATADLLVRLSKADGNSLRGVEIGDQLMINPTRVSRLVDRAEAAGIAVRTVDPNDRRAQQVRLTDEGREKAAEYAPMMLAVLRDVVFDELSGDEIETLISLLGRVRDRAMAVAV